MFDTLSHRRVALVALAALMALAGAAASAPVTADGSPTEFDRSPASMSESTTTDENVSAEFVYEGDRLTFHPADEQSVRLRTSVDPGTEFIVELRVDGNFFDAVGATVSKNGTGTATFDLRNVDPGTEFAVVAPDGTRAEAVIVEESTETATTHDESEFAFTTAATETDAPTDDATDRDDNDGIVPGFGVPAALVALLGALALVRRRRA